MLSAIDRLDQITLDEITALADLQQRRDRKYVVHHTDLADLLAELDTPTHVLTIGEQVHFGYRSTYFDTPELTSYLGSARRRPSRFKIRTRHYVDTNKHMLEIKTRDRRQRTVKHRIECDPTEAHGLSPSGQAFASDIDHVAPFTNRLRPELVTQYTRTTLLLNGGAPSRVTVDTDLVWHDLDGRALELGPWAIIETKSLGHPCQLDRILWRSGHRPTTISKYCTGRAALDPALPANKWHRVIRRHIGDRHRPNDPASWDGS